MGNRRDLVVLQRQPCTTEAIGVRDGATFAEVSLDLVHVGGPLRLDMGEVGCPIGDRTLDDRAANGTQPPLRELLVEADREAFVRGHPQASIVMACSGQLASANCASASEPAGTLPPSRTWP